MSVGPIYTDMLRPRGAGYRDEQVVHYSHYREPIDRSPGRLAGNSHRAGDARPEVQSRCIDLLIEHGRRAGLGPRDIALVLAIAGHESGFNPDAAAGTTTAFGLGQFVDRTGAAYGLDDGNRGDATEQARALVAHYKDNRRLARSRGQGDDYIYKYHHDGPSSDYGGLDISRRHVMPHLERYEAFVKEWELAHGSSSHVVRSPVPSNRTAHSRDPLADHTLQHGEDGEAVRHLQQRLNAHGMHGLDGKAVGETGHFRGNTEAAVREFQRAHGLVATGRADATTRAALEHTPSPPSHMPTCSRVEATHPRDAMADGRLAYGESGAAVRELQSRLNAWGIRDADGRPLPLTGNFRERTLAAVRGFQREHGLQETGVADRATLDAVAKSPELRRGDRGAEVVRLQQALGRAGISVPISGSFTYLTEGAVKEFQATHGLEPTGIVGGETRYRLHRIDAPALHVAPDARVQRHDDGVHADATRLPARAATAPPTHPLIEQLRPHVDALDRAAHRASDAGSDNLVASLAATANANGLDRIDRVVLSTDRERLVAVQGDGEMRRVASVDIRDAMATPAQASLARLEAASLGASPPVLREEPRSVRMA